MSTVSSAGGVRAHGVPAWVGFAVLVATLGVTYFTVPAAGVGPPWTDIIYSSVAVVSATAILVGVRRNRPRARVAWLLIAVGQFVFAAGDTWYVLMEQGLAPVDYPSPGDYLYLVSYPLTAIGLAVLVRRRTPSWHLPSMLDGAILSTGAALLFWVYLVAPLRAGSEGLGLETTLVNVAFPVMDLLLLTVAMFLMLGAGSRPTAYYLLVGGLAANLAADIGFASQTDVSLYTGPLDAGWLLAYALFGLAALHPSMRQLDERSPVAAPDATWRRLAALAVASLAAPGVLTVQYARGAELHVPLVAAVSALLFLLVLARMAQLVAAQRREAITDGLTGLHTRRFFEESLRVETDRVRRHGGGFGVVLLDIDHFKDVNDTYGHPGGDRVLCEVARRLRASTRAGDVVARYGGEEFGILLPTATDRDVAAFAENIRGAVGGAPITVDGRTVITVTVSGGTAALPDAGGTADEVVRAADRALYWAKNAGRNRIAYASALAAARPLPEPAVHGPAQE